MWQNATVIEETLPARRPLGLAIFLVIAGVIGWIASFALTLEKIETLVNPN
ncbi:MAG: hypothetical protein JWR01_1908 [Subtercola sp.]|nr:hypothetical protein [Subtercola sp.]